MNTSEDADLLPAEPEEALFMQKLLEDWLFLIGLFCRRYSEVADRDVL
jgi:hypothetical protein